MTEANRIALLLGELGNQADDIAAALLKRGIQGMRNTVSNLNPIVLYAQTQLRVRGVRLDVRTGHSLELTHYDGQETEVAALPLAVVAFLEGFNRGDYPELELTEA